MSTTATAPTAPNPNGPSTRLPGESMADAKRRLGWQPHGDGHGDHRGSPRDRKIRKLKILGALPIKRGPKVDFGGDGTHVNCVHCSEQLDYATLTVDRIDPDGAYVITNVQPACRRCNKARGDNPEWTYNPKIHNWGPNTKVVSRT